SIRSLIEKGNYRGDILIKTDNIEKMREFCKEFKNKFILSEIDKKLGIFNRYWLHEPCLEEYSSLIYFDSDILTIRDISATLKLFEQGDLASFIDGNPSFEKIQNYFDDTGSFPTHKWYGMQYVDKEYVRQTKAFHVLNSGLFIINDLAKIKPIMDKVIRYRFMEDRHGDQPFFNVALYNSDLDIKTLNHIGHLGFSHSNYDSFKNLDKVLIHYNIGVGYTSKLDLMKETWAYINRI
ncbi:glycosyltransferase, partial [Rodentibacter caecimuris]|uniref:glycosyltransferase n=1 Tax=Rodentibacter caecimuris TaxID=1796644 RepID=UPI00101ADB14